MLGWDCYCVYVRLELFYIVRTTEQQLCSIFFGFGKEFFGLHRKKSFSIFPSPAGMSLTKLSLGGNYDVICKLFLPMQGEFGKGHPRLGREIENLFLRCMIFSPNPIPPSAGSLWSSVRDGVGVAVLTHHTKPSTQTSIISLLLARPSGYTQQAVTRLTVLNISLVMYMTQVGRDQGHCLKWKVLTLLTVRKSNVLLIFSVPSSREKSI
jgi:hypothetical protein